ncbi:hypothetical protein TELCIR_15549, partial [Teladorsagia circumcincta]
MKDLRINPSMAFGFVKNYIYMTRFEFMQERNGYPYGWALFLKAIPCVLLFWFTIALIGRMKENKEKRKKLLKSRDDKGKRDVTTYMLVFMVTVFLVTELPQGVMAVLNALYTSQFHAYVYLALADVLDLLSLINCYVAFLVYICTCSRYRQTLLSILPNMPSNISRHSSVKREKLPYATIGANDTAT